MTYDIIIIGGGISGLYTLHKLTQKYIDANIILLESRSFMGGRIKTEYMSNNTVQYETGPWRFHNSHKRLIKLLNHYKLKFKQNTSSKAINKIISIPHCVHTSKTLKKNKPHSGLSYRDIKLQNQRCSSEIDMYDKLPLNMDSTSKPYDVGMSYTGKYYIMNNGFSHLIDLMTKDYNSNIITDCKVINIIRQDTFYNVYVQIRNKNKYLYKTFVTKYIFCCLPPSALLNYTISEHLLPIIHSIESIPLHHIYAKTKQDTSDLSFYYRTNSPLGHIISGDYNNWFQISYSAGENARYWERLKLDNKIKFKKTLLSYYEKFEKKVGIYIKSIKDIKSYYWENAIHIWRPVYGFDINKNVINSVYPHPVELPNLFLAGEACSSIQGWIEGSLETSEIAIDIFDKIQQKSYTFQTVNLSNPDDFITIDSRVLNIKKWKKRHPGSTKAIENHVKDKDAKHVFDQIGHSSTAYATLFAIQNFWLLNDQIGVFK
ncbi:MAG: hypothetical protein CBD11_00960 [Phycisphaera sp. TMED151]|nr:MAG: hypothetical protein CBD11_00960 [Phycisphaera sp. TMED151]RPG10726.1 MAG: hypothetical protein CBB84_000070 [Phycisphaera sp. TMED24]|tara:strand:- start:970 stop:2430 length:1461 start_codon:yes stop_codon:yes gene_type:complete